MHIDESKKFDKRTIDRNLKEGTVSAKEWEQFLKKLPDVSDKVEFVMSEETQEEETVEDKERTPKEPVGEERTRRRNKG
jgi:hypothetical protein